MIAAIILAAGESKRMGQPKMLLPWGKVTVIEHVVSIFIKAGIEDIVVVTSGVQERLEKAIEQYPVRTIHNDDSITGEMLSSLQYGLRALANPVRAALIGLGDQPQVEERSVRLIYDAYRERNSTLIVPSFQMRRGHPWLVARSYWNELLEMKSPESPRDFLNKHSDEIHYLEVNTSSILADLDTPLDYQKFHPK